MHHFNTDYFNDAVMQNVVNATAFPPNFPPGTGSNGVWLGLSTSIPDQQGNYITEPTDTAYVRQGIPCNGGLAALASGQGIFANVNSIQFPTPTTPWGTIVAALIFDGKSPLSCSAPVQTSPSTTSGGSLTNGTTYYYKITATNTNGESTGSNEESETVSTPNLSVVLNWTTVTNATGYKIYRGTAAGAENVLVATVGAVLTYTDVGGMTTPGSPPTINSTVSNLLAVNSMIYNPVNITTTGPFFAENTVRVGLVSDWGRRGMVSEYFANYLGNYLFTGTSYMRPSGWFALCKKIPLATDSGGTIVEPSGGGYARIAPSLQQIKKGRFAVAAQANWPTPTGSWGSPCACAVLDAQTVGTGNLLWAGLLNNPQAIAAGPAPFFAANAFQFGLE